MAWYRTGTVAVTNGSKTVTGTSTAWVNNVQPSDEFEGPDGKRYEVDQVVSNTSILLVEDYAGTTASGGAYKIIPTQGRVRDLTAAVLQVINDYGSIEAALTVLAGNLGLGKSPNSSARLDVSGQVWIDAPSGDATLRLLTSGAEKGKLAVTSAGRAYVESNGTEVMTWLNGNVGVGTTAPAVRMEVSGATTALRVSGTGGTPATLQLSSGGVAQWNLSANQGGGAEFGLSYSSTRYLTVTSGGNIGIGTDAPSAKLTVAGGALLSMRDSANGLLLPDFRIYNTASGNSFAIDNYSAQRFLIDGAGNVVLSAPATPPGLTSNGSVVFNLTSNGNLRISARGSDGVTRVANIPVA